MHFTICIGKKMYYNRVRKLKALPKKSEYTGGELWEKELEEIPITVYSELCACLTPETHAAAITVMGTQQAIIEA